MGGTDFSDQFRKIVIRHKRIGYDLNVMRQSECLVITPIRVDNLKELIFMFLFVVTAAGVVPFGSPKSGPVHRP